MMPVLPTSVFADSDRVARADEGGRRFVTREIAGETLIVPITGHVGDLNAIFTTNQVGSRIWALLDRPIGVPGLVAALVAEFEVAEDEAAHDVSEFLQSLADVGLIRRVPVER
jgi:hypothetical protein